MKLGNIQARKKMEWEMDLESLFITKEVSMKVTGKIIWCMEKEIFTILMEKLLMKEIGAWINFMVLGKYIMKINWQLRVPMTIQTSVM